MRQTRTRWIAFHPSGVVCLLLFLATAVAHAGTVMEIVSVTGDSNQVTVTSSGSQYILSRTNMEMWRLIDPASNAVNPRQVAELLFDSDIGPLSIQSTNSDECVLQSSLATFEFHGTLTRFDNPECRSGCMSDGRIGFSLNKAFGRTRAIMDNLGGAYLYSPLKGELTMAHELAHVMVKEVNAYESQYLDWRGFRQNDDGTWSERDTSGRWHLLGPQDVLTVYNSEGYHHLVHMTALYVSAGNTWSKISPSNIGWGRPVTPADQTYIQTFFSGVPSLLGPRRK